MKRTNLQRSVFPIAIGALVSLAGCHPTKDPSPPAPVTTASACPADATAGAVTRKAGSDLWDICAYKRSGPAIDMSIGYFSLILSAEAGDSEINRVSDAGVWQRVLGKIDKNVHSAVVTMRLGNGISMDANPALPVIALARASDGESPPNAAIPDGRLLMPYTLMTDGTDRWGVEIDYRFGVANRDKAVGGIVSLGQKVLALYPIGGAVGTLLPKVTDEDRKDLNDFVSSLRSYKLAPAPTRLFYSPAQWGEIDHLTIVFYDKPAGTADRRTVVTLRIQPDHLVSIYTQKQTGDGQPDYSKYRSGASYRAPIQALAGTTEDVFKKVSPDLAEQIKTTDATVFAKVCMEGASRYASARLDAETDATFATWLTLMNSPARTTKAQAVMCDMGFESRMAELKLPKFPYQLAPNDADPAQRTQNLAQTKQNMNNLSAALNTTSPDLDAHFAEAVVVKQSAPVLPDVKTGETQVLTGAQVAENLKAANAQQVHTYRFTGVASTVAPAQLRVNGKDVPVQLEWSGVGPDAKVTAIQIEGK